MQALFAAPITNLIGSLSEKLMVRGLLLGTAESCTGGLLAGACTEVSGSSRWFAGGVVTYSNELKMGLLAVPEEALAAHGAVSEAVVRAMAEGAVRRLGVQLALAVSGVAGPDGGSVEKPVGTVWLAACLVAPRAGGCAVIPAEACAETGVETCAGACMETCAERRLFAGGRSKVRLQAVAAALELAEKMLGG